MLFGGHKMETLHDLFVQELKDMYNAELQLIRAIPKMAEAASSPDLRKDFEKHLQQTQVQAERLEDIFEMLDMEPEEEKCDGMAGIIAEGEKIIKSNGNPMVKDAGLIAAAQKVEHYEIASYGTLRTFAATLGHLDIASILQETLQEESRTDKLLTKVAESSVNPEAGKKKRAA